MARAAVEDECVRDRGEEPEGETVWERGRKESGEHRLHGRERGQRRHRKGTLDENRESERGRQVSSSSVGNTNKRGKGSEKRATRQVL